MSSFRGASDKNERERDKSRTQWQQNQFNSSNVTMFCDVRRHFGSDSKEIPFLSLWVLWSVRTGSSDLKYVALSFYTIYLSTCRHTRIFNNNNLTKTPAHNIVSHSWVWKREKRQRSVIPDQRREIQSEVGGNNSPAERRRGWNPEVRGQARWRRKPVTSLTPLSFTVATPRVTSVNKQEGWMKVSCEHTHLIWIQICSDMLRIFLLFSRLQQESVLGEFENRGCVFHLTTIYNKLYLWSPAFQLMAF